MSEIPATDLQRIKNIQNAIRHADAELKAKHPILNNQNAIGLTICLLACLGMLLSAAAYLSNIIPAWLCILISAFFAGISHEIEHDLIHRLYFRKNKWVHNFMMALVWLMRPNTVNPWYRRTIHFNHHKVSGTEHDIEERVLGNGMQFGFKRILIALDGFLSISLRQKELKSMKDYRYLSFVLKGAPLAHIFIICFYGFIAFHTYNLIAPSLQLNTEYPIWLLQVMDVVDVMAVVWLLPNALRAFSLHNITSVMHYYGDVTSVLNQCQVLKHPALMPLQLFCFNFGATHAMHHFVVSQPFYLRQVVAKDIYPVLKENGVRFNDFDSLLRSNRFTKPSTNSLSNPASSI